MRITLGKEGNQPFDIDQLGVSRLHATIDISEDGTIWTLTDNNSKNGTFIRESNGHYRRVGSIQITPMTFIRLGPETVHGCSFFAKRVLGDRKDYNYYEEFMEIQKVCRKYENKITSIEARATKIKWSQNILTFMVTLVFLKLLPLDTMMSGMNVPFAPWLLRIGVSSAITAIVNVVFNPQKKIKLLKAERDRFLTCPSPKCSHTLKVSEIEAMSCSKCKAK